MILYFKVLDTQILAQSELRIHPPPNMSLPKYYPPQISLRMSITPGLYSGIYNIMTSNANNSCNTKSMVMVLMSMYGYDKGLVGNRCFPTQL